MKLGIEIESVVNKSALRKQLSVGDYHRGVSCGTYWKAERDGSLSTSGCSFRDATSIEFVSVPIKTKEKWKECFDEYRNIFKEDKELFECVEYNTTCGMHVHFSGEYTIHTRAMFDSLVWLRKQFLDFIKNHPNLNAKAKKSIQDWYFRDYAQEVKEENWYKNGGGERRSEFNKVSEMEGKGLEWRSINVNGVLTWAELESIFMFLWDVLEEFIDQNKVFKYAKTHTFSKQCVTKSDELVVRLN